MFQIGEIHTPKGLNASEALDWMAERHALVTGLHELADWLAATPEAEVSKYDLRIDSWSYSKEQLAALARTPGKFEKNVLSTVFELCREFSGGVQFRANGNRNEVCEAVVVGTKTVQRPDPEALAAVPKVDVEEDIVEWRCGSLLG